MNLPVPHPLLITWREACPEWWVWSQETHVGSRHSRQNRVVFVPRPGEHPQGPKKVSFVSPCSQFGGSVMVVREKCHPWANESACERGAGAPPLPATPPLLTVRATARLLNFARLWTWSHSSSAAAASLTFHGAALLQLSSPPLPQRRLQGGVRRDQRAGGRLAAGTTFEEAKCASGFT
jgi:hypothetical protein